MRNKRIQLLRPVYHTSEVLKALKPILDIGWTGLGSQTQLFEQELANYLGAKYVVVLNSGTAGLHLAVKLLHLPEGSEVITTPLTFVSTNHVLLYERLKPVFCDIREETGCIDERKIEELINENTSAIMVVHYSGMPANMDEINRLGKIYNLPIIEDSAHALGASYRGTKIGDGNNISVLSFHAVKHLGISDGGAVVTNNRIYRERLEKIRWMGIDKSTYARTEGRYGWKYNIGEVGYKYHGNDILSIIGRTELKYLDEGLRRRAELMQMYHEGLADIPWIKFLPDTKYLEKNSTIRSANHLCVVRVPKKEEFMKRLFEQGIDTGCHYTPNYHYPMYDSQPLEVTEKLYGEIVSLPLHMKMTNKDTKYIIKTIREVWD